MPKIKIPANSHSAQFCALLSYRVIGPSKGQGLLHRRTNSLLQGCRLSSSSPPKVSVLLYHPLSGRIARDEGRNFRLCPYQLPIRTIWAAAPALYFLLHLALALSFSNFHPLFPFPLNCIFNFQRVHMKG